MGSSGVSRSLGRSNTSVCPCQMRGWISFKVLQRSKNGVCVIFFSGLDRQDGTSNQVLFSEDCQKPRLMMSSQQYRNISSSNIWSNHDISPEISCGSKWWLSVAFESKTSLVNVFDRASQPYHLSLSRPLHAGTHNLPNFVLTGVTQTAREMDGTWLTITHHSILCCETFSYPNCFVESLVHSPKLTTGGNVYKTNPEVWTHVLMRVPTWANLGHRRLQGFMMLDHVSFRISSSHLAISNPRKVVSCPLSS